MPFADGIQQDVFFVQDYEGAPPLYEGLGDRVQNPNGERTSKLWKQHFGLESGVGIVARTGMNKWRWGYRHSQGKDWTKFVETLDAGDIVDTQAELESQMKVGDVIHKFNGFTNAVWLYVGFIFNHWELIEPEVTIRLHDIIGNTNYAIWRHNTVNISPNAELTSEAYDELHTGEDGQTPILNCEDCTVHGEYSCEETEEWQEPVPMNLYNKNGMDPGRACEQDNHNCCDPIINDTVKMWANGQLKDFGTHSEFYCGVSDSLLQEFSNQFNSYIGSYTQAGGETYQGGAGTFGPGWTYGESIGVGMNFYNPSMFMADATQWVYPFGWDNMDHPTGAHVLLDLVAHDAYNEEAEYSQVNIQNFDSPCQQTILEARYYQLSPCLVTKGLNSSAFQGANDSSWETSCACDTNSWLGIDANRGFNENLSTVGNQDLISDIGGEIEPIITQNMLQNQWVGQFECTHCMSTPETHLGAWDFFEAPCGIGFGLLEPAAVTIWFDQLESNDFASITSNISYHPTGIWYMDGVCQMQLINEFGEELGEPIGNCGQATLNPYVDAEYVQADFTTIDNYDHAAGIVIKNCGWDMIMCQTLQFSMQFYDGYQYNTSNFTINWNGDEEISGCQDPGAYNYSPAAVFPCDDCCEYPEPIEEPEFELIPGQAEGSKIALVYTADLDRWDQVDMEENIYGAVAGKKGEVLLSAFANNTTSQSKLKIFQASETEETKQTYLWVSKKMNFGYDSIYKSIKRIKVVFAKTYNIASDVPYTKLMVASYPHEPSFTEINQVVEDEKTLKYEIPRSARKCKNIQFSIESKHDIESISVIYTMKGIK